MKKLTVAAAMAVLGTPAIGATTNVENPLYLPSAKEVYSRTALGLMYKQTGGSEALGRKGWSGAEEWPIYRAYQELGFGIMDNLAIRGKVAYTNTEDIDRAGLSDGRLGLVFRALDGKTTDGIVFDVYADAFLGGVSKMEGTMTPTGFVYDNYSTGQWGMFVGFQAGKTFDKFTVAAFAEAGYYFANDNTDVHVNLNPMLPAEADAKIGLKSKMDYAAGFKGVYEMDSKWTLGGSFTYRHREANKVDTIELSNATGAGAMMLPTAIAGYKGQSLDDRYEEYIFGLTVANQLTETVQVALYGEYTHDIGGDGSQNVADVKAEVGVRANVRF